MYHLPVSEFPVEGITWKIMPWAQWTFRIPKTECWDCCMAILMLIWQLHIYFLCKLFLKKFLTIQFNRRNTVYFKTMAHCVCCVWDSLERVWGSECAAGGFVVCVCVWGGVCVGVVCLWVEGNKRLLFQEPFACFMKVHHDVCNLRR